ncbi:MAG: addiction module protein [Fidelibacterota bacterium]
MKTKELLEEINKLELEEKLSLVEKIWKDIADRNSMPSLSEWQKNELDKRYKAYQQGDLNLHNSNMVHEKLRKKYK